MEAEYIIIGTLASFVAGLTVAFGPELWLGANPAAFAQYQRNPFQELEARDLLGGGLRQL